MTTTQPEDPTSPPDTLPLAVTHAQMNAAYDTGEAVPLAQSCSWLVRYRDAWRVVYEHGWLRVTDTATAEDLDRAASRLRRRRRRRGRCPRQRCPRRSLHLRPRGRRRRRRGAAQDLHRADRRGRLRAGHGGWGLTTSVSSMVNTSDALAVPRPPGSAASRSAMRCHSSPGPLRSAAVARLIRWEASPSPNGVVAWPMAGIVISSAVSLGRSLGDAVIRTRAPRASGRSVDFRKTMRGLPMIVASSWMPPESEMRTRARSMRARNAA